MATIIGIALALILVIISISIGEDGVVALLNFYNKPSILITFGGSFLVTLAMCPSVKDFFNRLASIKLILKKSNKETL